MNNQPKRQTLTLSSEMLFWMTTEQKAYWAARHNLATQPSFAPAEDLDQLREMAPVARCEVAHG